MLSSETVQNIRFNYEPEIQGVCVEFRLTYQGKLSAASASDTRVQNKNHIRQKLHKQLVELWKTHPELVGRRTEEGDIWFEQEGARYERCGIKFIPLLTDSRGLACALEILFLRRDVPGKVIGSGGDIDNRLKVLFDAMRLPTDCSEIPKGWAPDADESPMYCLLDDDKIITTLSVTTDQLLSPMVDGEAVNDVVLIIKVKAIVTDLSKGTWGFM